MLFSSLKSIDDVKIESMSVIDSYSRKDASPARRVLCLSFCNVWKTLERIPYICVNPEGGKIVT
jgi:hypothetical protein